MAPRFSGERHTDSGVDLTTAATIRTVQLLTRGQQASAAAAAVRRVARTCRDWPCWASSQAARCRVESIRTPLATSTTSCFTSSAVTPQGIAFAKRRRVARAALWAAHRKPRAVQRRSHMFPCTREPAGEVVCALRQRRDQDRSRWHPSAHATSTACARQRDRSEAALWSRKTLRHRKYVYMQHTSYKRHRYRLTKSPARSWYSCTRTLDKVCRCLCGD